MAIDLNDEIVQDFLVEAGEILEQLGMQLVDLELRPDDRDLLNSVFRGFHTIKGGAGFLALDALVEVCHTAEDVFNLLRQGERQVDAALMDLVLQVLDVVNAMFAQVREGQDPDHAPADVLNALKAVQSGEPAPAAQAEPPAERPVEPQPAEDTAQAEAHAEPAAEASTGSGESEDITEQEFEALLDALAEDASGAKKAAQPVKPAKGSKASKSAKSSKTSKAAKTSKATEAAAAQSAPSEAGGEQSDLITDDEFEALLDQLHGKGQEVAAGAPQSPPPETAKAAAPAHDSGAPQPPVPAKDAAAAAPSKAAGREAAPQGDTTVRVETSTLDTIMNMVGELVLIRNRIATLEGDIGNEEMTKTASALDVVTTDLQAAVMKTRMQPIKKVFGRFPRVVRDLARSLNKEVELVLQGEDTDLDKNLVEALADPLVHLVRNAVDHGIETPEGREAAGKPRKGTLRLSAEQEGDHILLTIQDDGAGMDPEALRRKAVEKGLMDADAAARLDARECFDLIFAPGFSTKTEISDVSGRGVGMDVVKTRINQLNGMIEIDSERGKGTRIYIKVPLTLAIMPTLMVVLGRQVFALPLVNVNEIIECDSRKMNTVDGQKVVLVRGKALPLFCLSHWLVRGGESAGASGHIVVVSIGTNRVGLLVDQLLGREEVVIKPLGALLHGTRGLAGATITGDGKIALIIDLPSLIATYARRI